jgi:hypothetical protein
VDDRIRVKHTRVADVSSDARPLQNREHRHYAWKTTVTNRSGKAITLQVVDQVPASGDAAFQVDVETSPTVTIPKTGVFIWEMSLENGKTQDFTLSYDVSWPQGDAPQLME